MFGIGPTELLVILVVALLVLGPKRLPDLARSLGKAIGEFKRATADIQTEIDNARIMLEEETRAAARESANKGRGYAEVPKPTAAAPPGADAAVANRAPGEAGAGQTAAETDSSRGQQPEKST